MQGREKIVVGEILVGFANHLKNKKGPAPSAE